MPLLNGMRHFQNRLKKCCWKGYCVITIIYMKFEVYWTISRMSNTCAAKNSSGWGIVQLHLSYTIRYTGASWPIVVTNLVMRAIHVEDTCVKHFGICLYTFMIYCICRIEGQGMSRGSLFLSCKTNNISCWLVKKERPSVDPGGQNVLCINCWLLAFLDDIEPIRTQVQRVCPCNYLYLEYFTFFT